MSELPSRLSRPKAGPPPPTSRDLPETAAPMTKCNCTRQPASQPAVTACSRGRRSTKARIASRGANKMTRLVEAAAKKPTTAATAIPVRCPGAPQHRPEQREQQVPEGVDATVGDLHRRARQQDHAHGEQDPQCHGPDVPGARMEDEQRASGCDQRPEERESLRGIGQLAGRSRTGRPAAARVPGTHRTGRTRAKGAGALVAGTESSLRRTRCPRPESRGLAAAAPPLRGRPPRPQPPRSAPATSMSAAPPRSGRRGTGCEVRHGCRRRNPDPAAATG